jgi:hypothetical protein
MKNREVPLNGTRVEYQECPPSVEWYNLPELGFAPEMSTHPLSAFKKKRAELTSELFIPVGVVLNQVTPPSVVCITSPVPIAQPSSVFSICRSVIWGEATRGNEGTVAVCTTVSVVVAVVVNIVGGLVCEIKREIARITRITTGSPIIRKIHFLFIYSSFADLH